MPTATDGPRRRGGLAPVVLAALLGLSAGDLLRPPESQAGTRLALGAIGMRLAALARHHLHRNLTLELLVEGEPHGREAARTQRALGEVLADPVLPCHKLYLGGRAVPVHAIRRNR